MRNIRGVSSLSGCIGLWCIEGTLTCFEGLFHFPSGLWSYIGPFHMTYIDLCYEYCVLGGSTLFNKFVVSICSCPDYD